MVGAMKKNIYTLGGIEGDGNGILNRVAESFSNKVIDVWAYNKIKWWEIWRYLAGTEARAGAFHIEGRERTKASRLECAYYVCGTAQNLMVLQ